MRRWWLCLLMSVALAPAPAAHAEQPAAAPVVAIASNSEAARQIRVVAVRREKVAGRIDATATVEPDARAVAQITTPIPARVVRLIADPGQNVSAGEPLAILSSVELGQAKAQYLKARSLRQIAEQHLQREQDLYAKKIAPLKDLLSARAERDTAVAEYEAAHETLRLLIPASQLEHLSFANNGTPLSEFPLTSPLAGTLVRRNLTVGEAVDREHTLMTVINLEHVWVITNVFEHDLHALQTGAPAWITVSAYPGHRFQGRVFYVGDEVDRKTRTVEARIEVPNPERLLKPGMFAQAEISALGTSREALAVPQSSVFVVGG